jgi:hypothetical protein
MSNQDFMKLPNFDDPELLAHIKALSKWGLGVTIPHAHDEYGEFKILPTGMMALEEDLSVRFVSTELLKTNDIVPVGWMWRDNKVIESMGCCGRSPSTSPELITIASCCKRAPSNLETNLN